MNSRSYLYVPAHAERKLARARGRGADAIIIDLEDAVASHAKTRARLAAHAALTATDGNAEGEVWVRVNQPPAMAADIAAVAVPGLTGIVVPKAEPGVIDEADAFLNAAEERAGLMHVEFAIIALVENARGLLSAPAIAGSGRVVRLGLGEADLLGELGIRPSTHRDELTSLRLQLVVASAAAGLPPPIGPVETKLGDEQQLRSSTRVLADLGFRARTALHPGQLAIINETFTPSSAEVEAARRTIATLATANESGTGVAVDDQGQFIDAAVAKSSYETLMRHNDHARLDTRGDAHNPQHRD